MTVRARSLKKTLIVATLAGVAWTSNLHAQTPPRNFLYTSSSDLSKINRQLIRPDIEGVQVIYSWKTLETVKDHYDFSTIEADLKLLDGMHKKLFIQVQDRFFRPQDKNVPAYLMKDPIYGGGIAPQSDHPGEGKALGSGWVAEQWNPNVRRRYQMLLVELAKQFDGRAYGVNLPETSVEVATDDSQNGFTCDKYFDAELENMKAARQRLRSPMSCST